MNFTENGKEGRPAIALIAKTSRRIADPAKPGLGGDHNKVDVPAGYIRAVRLIPQADAGGLRQVRRELLAIVGGDCGSSLGLSPEAEVEACKEAGATGEKDSAGVIYIIPLSCCCLCCQSTVFECHASGCAKRG